MKNIFTSYGNIEYDKIGNYWKISIGSRIITFGHQVNKPSDALTALMANIDNLIKQCYGRINEYAEKYATADMIPEIKALLPKDIAMVGDKIGTIYLGDGNDGRIWRCDFVNFECCEIGCDD